MTAPAFDLPADGTFSLGELADRTWPDEPFASGADFRDDPHVADGWESVGVVARRTRGCRDERPGAQ